MSNLNVASALDRRKLFIGNISASVTEFQLLELCRQYGTIKAFNFIPPKDDARLTFCFVEYSTVEEAAVAKDKVSQSVLDRRKLRVEWAKVSQRIAAKRKAEVDSNAKSPALSNSAMISAIERKLVQMEKNNSNS